MSSKRILEKFTGLQHIALLSSKPIILFTILYYIVSKSKFKEMKTINTYSNIM